MVADRPEGTVVAVPVAVDQAAGEAQAAADRDPAAQAADRRSVAPDAARPADPAAGNCTARSVDGTYSINVSGFFTGNGTASVTATAVSITATVTVDGGGTVTLQSEALPLSGPYFEGKATAGSDTVLIKGRLDAAKASRLLATYSTVGDTRRGRIAGTLPTDKPIDAWNDNSGHH